MTIDEAKEILKRYDINFCDSDGNPISAEDLAEAYEVAIKSLEAWDKIRKEIASDGQSDINAKYVLNLIDKHLKEVENDN